MTILTGTSPCDGAEQVVIVCENVTHAQLEALGKVLERALQSMPGPKINIATPEDIEWCAVFNMLCDLEVEGYEV